MKPRFKVYQDKSGQWRWRLLAANNRIIADSAEGYASKRNAERARDNVIDQVVTVAARPYD